MGRFAGNCCVRPVLCCLALACAGTSVVGATTVQAPASTALQPVAAAQGSGEDTPYWRGRFVHVAKGSKGCLLVIPYPNGSYMIMGFKPVEKLALLSFSTKSASFVKAGEKRKVNLIFGGANKKVISRWDGYSAELMVTGDGDRVFTIRLAAEPLFDVFSKASGMGFFTADNIEIESFTLTESALGVRQLRKCSSEVHSVK